MLDIALALIEQVVGLIGHHPADRNLYLLIQPCDIAREPADIVRKRVDTGVQAGVDIRESRIERGEARLQCHRFADRDLAPGQPARIGGRRLIRLRLNH